MRLSNKITGYFFLLLCLLLLPQTQIFATIVIDGFEDATWTQLTESSNIDLNGQHQSMCATDHYLVFLIDSNKNATTPDTLIALYRNDVDPQGNPVTKYSYAFHVTEMDYEHGNGMTYNPNTQEIAIAGLFTNNPENAGTIFLVDANTLTFKRKVRIGEGNLNYFGIDYVPEKDQYVLMSNRTAGYSFLITDSNFEIVENLDMKLSHSRSSFQDFCVVGDYIISLPYMQRDGYQNIIDVYSISKKERVGSYYLTFPNHSAFEIEPEGICMIEPGHFLISSAIKGSTNFELHELYIPLQYEITTSVSNGTITEGMTVLEHESYTIDFSPMENYELDKLLVNGAEISIEPTTASYTLEDITSNQNVEAIFTPIPSYSVTVDVKNGFSNFTKQTVLRGESLSIESTAGKFYRLSKFLVNGEKTKFDETKNGITLDNIQNDYTISIVYSRLWLLLIIVPILLGICFTYILFLQHLCRRRKHEHRVHELERMRKEFQDVDDEAAATGDVMDEDEMKLLELETLLKQLGLDE